MLMFFRGSRNLECANCRNRVHTTTADVPWVVDPRKESQSALTRWHSLPLFPSASSGAQSQFRTWCFQHSERGPISSWWTQKKCAWDWVVISECLLIHWHLKSMAYNKKHSKFKGPMWSLVDNQGKKKASQGRVRDSGMHAYQLRSVGLEICSMGSLPLYNDWASMAECPPSPGSPKDSTLFDG